ncbi:hypothetical protein SAMN05660649_04501 [Desulfotomaculum arcticum]|uniref:Uncharacterized protein n=1 Tax=Desulfotruncus arcticus DSM 17038 TaxID=1121424 RepID=A0A1I2YMV3_9FIRM|nr:hypothetical protein [Desulfotruncus arcticus]SFH26972.1 hypothetical protein SAMN05660649_04501 [Desulfotomaculum arcticum] [Desulfotruncus arcticus DSM 17038]
MLTELITGISQMTARELREAGEPERKKLVEALTDLTELGIALLHESPEFRQAFARIHSEFLMFPESRDTIEQAFTAYNKFCPEN